MANPFFRVLLGQGASGEITIVQSASGTTADGSNVLTVNFDVPVTAGNSVIALCSWGDNDALDSIACVGGGAEPLTIIDSDVPGAGFNINIATANNIAGGETGVVMDTFGSVRADLQILEVSGLADAAAEDTASDSGEDTDAVTAGAITPTSSDNIIFLLGAINEDQFTSTPPTGFTLLETSVGGASVWQQTAYKIQSAADAQSPVMTLKGAANFAACAAVFGGA